MLSDELCQAKAQSVLKQRTDSQPQVDELRAQVRLVGMSSPCAGPRAGNTIALLALHTRMLPLRRPH
jgi:hypothetical protein